jgi:hypothetical protein
MGQAGSADCQDRCVGTGSENRRLCSYPNNPCDAGNFCNYDHGPAIGGYCEPCDENPDRPEISCHAYEPGGCEACGLAPQGTQHCLDMCFVAGRPAAPGGSTTPYVVIFVVIAALAGGALYAHKKGMLPPLKRPKTADGGMISMSVLGHGSPFRRSCIHIYRYFVV